MRGQSVAINWSIDMEANLFYAMVDHKPVGENKHFHMIFIYDKFNQLSEKKLNTDKIWQHLGTLYDLQALNDTEFVPFPNDETDFTLPQSEFSDYVKKADSVQDNDDDTTSQSVEDTQMSESSSSKNTNTSSSNDIASTSNTYATSTLKSEKDNVSIDNASNISDDAVDTSQLKVATPKTEPKKRAIALKSTSGSARMSAAKSTAKKRKN